MLIENTRGYISATSIKIDQEADAADIPVVKQSGHFHVTLLTKDELRSLDQNRLAILDRYLRSQTVGTGNEIVNLGMGCHEKRSIYFQVIHWCEGAALRAKLGLPVKDFHVTLSVKDDHGIRRDITTVRQNNFNSSLSERDFDKAFLAYYSDRRNEEACALATLFRHINRYAAIAHIRFADAQQRMSQHKYAMLAYVYAGSNLLSDGPAKMREYALSMICKATRFTEFPCAYTEPETLQAEMAVQDGFSEYLSAPSMTFQQAIRARYADEVWDRWPVSLPSRERMFICSAPSGEPLKLPRYFRWLVPYRLAVMSTPRDVADIEAMRAHFSITLVVTLTKETPLPADWFVGSKGAVENLFMPVENYKAPSIAQVDHFIKRITTLPAGEAAVVHCGAGKGRAGTFAACYAAIHGLGDGSSNGEPRNAADVIRLLRHMRPGSIETEEQERFVSKYVSHLWKSLGTPVPSAEPVDPETPLQLDGPVPSNTRTIILCGLPGSGKSRFATDLLESAPDSFQILSQDEIGSRSAFISSLSTAVKSRRRVIVDKCNPTIANRHELLAIAFNPPNAICVHFSYPAAVCTARADGRTAHPTIRQGSAERIVNRFEKEFTCPTRSEGFACVATVTSFAAARALLVKLGGSSNGRIQMALPTGSAKPQVGLHIHKFPRTRHLFNLGAATRDDLILSSSEVDAFLKQSEGVNITLEEKVDGANMGISIDVDTLAFRVQNRSHHINSKSHEQFRKLDAWLDLHSEDLRAVIEPGTTILFGEWVFAQHSVPYSRLPDSFLAFDLYDKESKQFASRAMLTQKLIGTSLHQVPLVELPLCISSDSLMTMVTRTQSKFYDGLVEGIYVRREKPGVVMDRAKVVRKGFIGGNEHWNKSSIILNGRC